MEIKQVAKICHNVNRAYCESIGDNSQLSWDEAPDWQKKRVQSVAYCFIGRTMLLLNSHTKIG